MNMPASPLEVDQRVRSRVTGVEGTLVRIEPKFRHTLYWVRWDDYPTVFHAMRLEELALLQGDTHEEVR